MASNSSSKRSKLFAGSKTAPVDDTIFDSLSVIHPHTAGIDIGAEKHYVSVASDCDALPTRIFGCFTPDILEMADWLKACKIRHVVMESTGVYWMPAYQILAAAGFIVELVDARHTMNVPGRKTDVWDARWLRKLHTFGLLRGCFLPPVEVEEMRAYWRHRDTLIDMVAQQTQRAHKSLEMMNIQLHKVVSDTTGVTGMGIIRAIIAGEHDPHILAAKYRQRGLKHTEETFVKALTGNYKPEHLFTLGQAVASHDFIAGQIAQCDAQLKACMTKIADRQPFDGDQTGAGTPPDQTPKRRRPHTSKNEPDFDMHVELIRIAGVDLAKIDGIGTQTFQTIIAECGPILVSKFPTEGRFCSWLGLAPNNRITGGKVKSRRTRRVNNRVTLALRLAAQSLHHSQSALGAFYRRMRTKLGAPKAIVATAHKLARLIWRLLTYGQAYVDIGQERYEEQTKERQFKALKRAALAMGCSIIINDTGELCA